MMMNAMEGDHADFEARLEPADRARYRRAAHDLVVALALAHRAQQRAAEAQGDDLGPDEDVAVSGAITDLFFFIHHSQHAFQARAVYCAMEGAIDGLLLVARTRGGAHVCHEAYQTLGSMCFSNPHVSACVVTTPGFVDLAKENMHNPELCYLLNNVTAYSWLSHPSILPLVPRAIAIIRSTNATHSKAHRAWCVRFCGQLAYNEANHDRLREIGLVEGLVEAMASGDVHLACCTAAVGVGCLIGPQHNHPALSAGHSTRLVSLLLGAFEASIYGLDFPRGSNVYYYDWKLAMGLSNLSATPVTREQLLAQGILPLVTKALKHNRDPRLCRHALRLVWNVSHG